MLEIFIEHATRRPCIDLLLKINPQHFAYLNPLVKWKILSVKELYALSGYVGRKNSFHKVVDRFEKENVVKSFKDLWSRNKYLYLTSVGEKVINHSDHQMRLSEDRLLHDLRLSEIVRTIVTFAGIENYYLEHEFYKKGDYGTAKQTPDARLVTNFLGQKSKSVGIELELTQKSKERAREKMESYLNSSLYDYALYFFTLAQIARSYHSLALESFSEKDAAKFVFLTDEGIARGQFNFEHLEAKWGKKTVKFAEIFMADERETWWRR